MDINRKYEEVIADVDGVIREVERVNKVWKGIVPDEKAKELVHYEHSMKLINKARLEISHYIFTAITNSERYDADEGIISLFEDMYKTLTDEKIRLEVDMSEEVLDIINSMSDDEYARCFYSAFCEGRKNCLVRIWGDDEEEAA